MLTNRFLRGHDPTKDDRKLIRLNDDNSLTSVSANSSKLLTRAAEIALTWPEWCEAWDNILPHVERHMGKDYADDWRAHCRMICEHPHRDLEWPALSEYCYCVRIQAERGPINPATWHDKIYDNILHRAKYHKDTAPLFPTPSQNENSQPPPMRAPEIPRRADVFAVASEDTFQKTAPGNPNPTESQSSSLARKEAGCSMGQNSATNLTAPADATRAPARTPLTPAHYAAALVMEPSRARPNMSRPPLSLLPDMWEAELRDLGLLEEFDDVPTGLRVGFRIGAAGPVTKTLIPNNHGSARINPSIIAEHIHTELDAGRYCGPFDQNTLEHLIGPFSVAPLGVVEKSSTPGKYRIIQDFSYPRTTPSPSLNAQINSDEFPCTWGFFRDVVNIIADAPPGTMAATFDVDAAYRQMPIHDIDLPHTVVHWDGQFYIDFRVPFGAGSSNGIFARCGDSMAIMYSRKGFGFILKWVDDFLFIQFPHDSTGGVDLEIFGKTDAVYAFADKLGWPWKRSKTVPFASTFAYLGFHWDINSRRVTIPCKKREKYLARIQAWISASKVSLKETQVVIGSLVHCALVIPEGRPRLAGLIAFAASFPHAHTQRFIKKTHDKRALTDAQWWINTLQTKDVGCQIQKPPPTDNLAIFTDASTSYGLGIIIGTEWAAWTLKKGWKRHGRDIGWAEIIAVELAVLWAIKLGCHNKSIIIHCDNQGVVFAWQAGRSRNQEQNEAIARIMAQCMAHNIWLSLEYIETSINPADNPSRGIRPAGGYTHTLHPLSVPTHLHEFISHVNLPS